MEHIMESIGFMLSKDFKKRTKWHSDVKSWRKCAENTRQGS